LNRSAARGSCFFREELDVLGIRQFAAVALLFGIIGGTAVIRAQDDKPKADAKAQEKPAEKAADKPAEAQAAAGDKVDIKWKFEKDKKIYQEMTTKTTQVMKVMNMDVNQVQEQTFYFSWEMKDEDKDKNMTLVQRIEGVNLSIEIAGNPIKYNSSNPGSVNTSLGEFFKQLVGTEFKLTLDKDMKVTKVEGRDEFLRKLGQANQTMEPMLKRVLNEEALKQMADPMVGLLPGKPVGKGDTWTRDSKLNLGPIGSYKNNFKYTLDKIDKDIAEISVTSKLTYEPPTEGGEGLPFRIKSAKLDSKDSGGKIFFDVKKGRLEKQELRIKLEGELVIEIAGTETKVDLKQEQTTTVTTSDQPQMKKS
jgi:hypothetical protein